MNKETNSIDAKSYAATIAIQMRKGYLAYCLLQICHETMYTSDIIKALRGAELVAVEGTIYPLLSRLQKDGLLEHEWQESKLGAPRKYYKITNYGRDVHDNISHSINTLNETIGKLKGGNQS